MLAVMLAYVASHEPSLVATPAFKQSAERLAMELGLVGLAAAAIVNVTSQSRLRLISLTWLASTAAIAVLSLGSLVAFPLDPNGPIYQYSRFQLGTLPPGHYPRLASCFLNANMACNYLTVSSGLLIVAWHQRWLANRAAALLFAAIIVAAVPTLSPGLGGILLSLGIGAWLMKRCRLCLGLSFLGAAAVVVALALTPIPHSTAPFFIELPGTSLILAPSSRFLTWSAAFHEFTRHPLVGHGIGIPAAPVVRYVTPSGEVQLLTDAHNIFLSIAAQTGLVGLCGLAAIIGYALRLAFAGSTVVRLLAITFLSGFVYRGLGGSFENAHHLWIVFGLAAAANRLPLSPADENNRRAGAPSPG